MALHAVENVEEAFSVTREFLTPVDVRRWLKLALVVFFVGGGVSFPTAQFNTSTPPGDVSNGGLPFSLPADIVTLVVVFVVWTLAQVPVVTYLRYYALLVLGDIEESFDVLPGPHSPVEEQ